MSEHTPQVMTQLDVEGRRIFLDGDLRGWNNWRAGADAHDRVTNFRGVELPTGSSRIGWPLHRIDFTDAQLCDVRLSESSFYSSVFDGAQLRNSRLNLSNCSGASFRHVCATGASFRGSILASASFVGACLEGAKFDSALCRLTTFDSAALKDAVFSGVNLSGCSLQAADLTDARLVDVNLDRATLERATLRGTCLSGASLVETRIEGAWLESVDVRGAAIWDVIGSPRHQERIKFEASEGVLAVTNDLEMAPILHLLRRREKLGELIARAGQRNLLLLGPFDGGGRERLIEIATYFGDRFIPIIFDFTPVEGRNLREVIQTLAGLSKLAIADLSGPSVPYELQATIPSVRLPIIPITPRDHRLFGMSVDLWEQDWVYQPVIEYDTAADLITKLLPAVDWAERYAADRARKLRVLQSRTTLTLPAAPRQS